MMNKNRRKTKMLIFGLLLWAPLSMVKANEENVLEPMDLTSPRATLNSFLSIGDTALTYFRDVYWKHPSPEAAQHIHLMVVEGERSLDLSQLPPGAQYDMGRDGFVYLYEVLSRLELPPLEEIPGAEDFLDEEGSPLAAAGWTVPHTEIRIVRIETGENAGQFRFSHESVSRAEEFYRKVAHLPYTRDVPVEDYATLRTYISTGGWLISPHMIDRMPGWLKRSLHGQAVWKWMGLLLMLAILSLVIGGVHRVSRRGLSGHSTTVQLRRLATPLTLWLLAPVVLNLANRQLSLMGWVSAGTELVSELVGLFSLAWIIWIGSMLVAETIISSPRIADQSLNAHLLRLVARCAGILGVIIIIFQVSERMGAPLYSLFAGLGVGGVAIALAAQNTIENFIGSLNLFADTPVRVGDFCRYGEDPTKGWKRVGTVESIGLRSTRIRGIDHTITTIPNGEFSRMHLINYSLRDMRLFLTVIRLRYDTTEDQLRVVLVELRKMLVSHPRVVGDDPLVRLKGFGTYAFKIEIRADIDTANFTVYRAIQEDIMLRMITIVNDAGVEFAVPARTVYHAPDEGPSASHQLSAEVQVKQWRENEELPFPDFSAAFCATHKNTLDYPPDGAPKPEAENQSAP